MSVPTVRQPNFDFSGLDRDWYDNNATLTHAANALHLLFPQGERFFVRSVRVNMDKIQDPNLKARVRAFTGQETMHGKLHEQASRAIAQQGYEIDPFLVRFNGFLVNVVEAYFPKRLCLSITAALEHLTATFAMVALEEGRIDQMAAPMDDMMRWHALEEIEHRDVAFDVYIAVGGWYGERVLGMALAVGGLIFAWGRAAKMLQAQDARITKAQRRADWAKFRARGWSYDFLRKSVWEYVQPSFHPATRQVDALVAQALAKLQQTQASWIAHSC